MVWGKTLKSDISFFVCFGWIKNGNGGGGMGYHKKGRDLESKIYEIFQ